MENIQSSADHRRTTVSEALEVARRIIATPSKQPRRLPLPDKGTVYFIQAGEDGPIKIGTTENLKLRIRNLQRDRSDRLTLRATRKGGVKTERRYHDRFADHRIGLSEWFNPALEILAEIDRLKAEGREECNV